MELYFALVGSFAGITPTTGKIPSFYIIIGMKLVNPVNKRCDPVFVLFLFPERNEKDYRLFCGIRRETDGGKTPSFCVIMVKHQDPFLNAIRQRKVPVTIFLTNGVQLKGQIIGFDPFIVLLQSNDGKQHMIFKHAISTIVPAKPVRTDEKPEQETKIEKVSSK